MKKNITLLLIIAVLSFSCLKGKQVLEGELYFKLIEFGSFYNVDKKTIEKFEESIDSIRLDKMANKNDLELIRFYDVLKLNKLLNSPFINLKIKSDIKKIYLNESEYEKLKKFTHNKLVLDNKKVLLKIKVSELDSGIYFSDKILDYKLTDGKTYWRK